MPFEKFNKLIALLKDARSVAARLLFYGNARTNPQIILLAGILERAQSLVTSMRADAIEMALMEATAEVNGATPATPRFPRRSSPGARSDIIPFDRRRREKDRRQIHTFIAGDRRSGIADRRRRGQRPKAAR